MKLPNDYTRCRDDACPQRWECMRYALPFEAEQHNGARSYIATFRDEQGQCSHGIMARPVLVLDEDGMRIRRE